MSQKIIGAAVYKSCVKKDKSLTANRLSASFGHMTNLLFQEQGFGFWVAFTDLIKPKCASLASDVWGLSHMVSDSSEIVWRCDASIVWEKPGEPSSTHFKAGGSNPFPMHHLVTP